MQAGRNHPCCQKHYWTAKNSNTLYIFFSVQDARGDQCDSCGNLLNPTDLINPKCKLTGTTPVLRTTKHIFLDLPKLSPQLQAYITETSNKGGWSNNCVQVMPCPALPCPACLALPCPALPCPAKCPALPRLCLGGCPQAVLPRPVLVLGCFPCVCIFVCVCACLYACGSAIHLCCVELVRY